MGGVSPIHQQNVTPPPSDQAVLIAEGITNEPNYWPQLHVPQDPADSKTSELTPAAAAASKRKCITAQEAVPRGLLRAESSVKYVYVLLCQKRAATDCFRFRAPAMSS